MIVFTRSITTCILLQILTIAAAMSFKSPFVSPLDKREEADATKQRMSGGNNSDHLTLLRAYDGWSAARRKHGHRGEREFCRNNFLSRQTLVQVSEVREQFANLLADIGFMRQRRKGGKGKRVSGRDRSTNRITAAAVSDGNSAGCQRGSKGEKMVATGKGKGPGQSHGRDDDNAYAHVLQLVKAVCCAGLYPNVLVVPQDQVHRQFFTQSVRHTLCDGTLTAASGLIVADESWPKVQRGAVSVAERARESTSNVHQLQAGGQ